MVRLGLVRQLSRGSSLSSIDSYSDLDSFAVPSVAGTADLLPPMDDESATSSESPHESVPPPPPPPESPSSPNSKVFSTGKTTYGRSSSLLGNLPLNQSPRSLKKSPLQKSPCSVLSNFFTAKPYQTLDEEEKADGQRGERAQTVRKTNATDYSVTATSLQESTADLSQNTSINSMMSSFTTTTNTNPASLKDFRNVYDQNNKSLKDFRTIYNSSATETAISTQQPPAASPKSESSLRSLKRIGESAVVNDEEEKKETETVMTTSDETNLVLLPEEEGYLHAHIKSSEKAAKGEESSLDKSNHTSSHERSINGDSQRSSGMVSPSSPRAKYVTSPKGRALGETESLFVSRVSSPRHEPSQRTRTGPRSPRASPRGRIRAVQQLPAAPSLSPNAKIRKKPSSPSRKTPSSPSRKSPSKELSKWFRTKEQAPPMISPPLHHHDEFEQMHFKAEVNRSALMHRSDSCPALFSVSPNYRSMYIRSKSAGLLQSTRSNIKQSKPVTSKPVANKPTTKRTCGMSRSDSCPELFIVSPNYRSKFIRSKSAELLTNTHPLTSLDDESKKRVRFDYTAIVAQEGRIPPKRIIARELEMEAILWKSVQDSSKLNIQEFNRCYQYWSELYFGDPKLATKKQRAKTLFKLRATFERPSRRTTNGEMVEADSLRGLERIFAGNACDLVRSEHVQHVLQAQSSRDPATLRRVSLHSSRMPKYFARQMAKYDTQESLKAVLSKWHARAKVKKRTTECGVCSSPQGKDKTVTAKRRKSIEL